MIQFDAWIRCSAGLSMTFVLALGLVFPALAQRNLTATAAAASAQTQPIASVEREKRLALVIGNNSYREAKLTASIHDARAMASALTELGFKVVRLEDAGRLTMLRAVRSFVDELNGSNSVGLFYFAGHGAQSKGKNFLIPIDADIEHEDEIELQGVDLQYMLDKFADMRNGMNILILDACRNNPFAQRGVKRASGLAAIDGPPGTLVAFAAAPGQVAREIDGGNGIYTKNVLANIREPGLPIEEVFKRVRLGVLAETGKLQVPWENTSLVRDFYFRGAPIGSGYRPAITDSEAEAWGALENSRNIYDFIGFLRRFPQSRYQTEILGRINSILLKLKPAPPMLQLSELSVLLNEAHAGFGMRPLNNHSAQYFGLPDSKGVIVTDIERGSASERAGLLPGDVIRKVNGKVVNDAKDVMDLARTLLPGEYVHGVVWRKGGNANVSGLTTRAPLERLLGRVAYDHLMTKNYERAKAFYEYLAATDDAAGQSALGNMHLAGLGVQRDYKVAESFLLQAALQGKTIAAALLASIYLTPASGIKNDAAAFRWAKYSAEAGVPEGSVLLASAYARGVGAPKNLNEAVRWARIAAEQGQSVGMFILGTAYESGAGGLSQSVDEAKIWYRRSGDLGNPSAKAALQRLGG